MESIKSETRNLRKNQEIFKKVIKDLVESVGKLRKNMNDAEEIIKDKQKIEDMIKDYQSTIENLDEKLKVITDVKNDNLLLKKRCIYYNKGFCKAEESGKFYHPKTICDKLLTENIC